MKKALNILLVLCMVLTVMNLAVVDLAAAEDKPVLRFMCWGSTKNVDRNLEGIRKTHPELFDKFDVEVIVGGAGEADVAEKFRLGLAAQESICDIVQMNYAQVPEFARADALYDMSPVIEKYKDDMLPAAYKLAHYDGKAVCMPFELKGKLFYYRNDIFKDCGVDPTQWKTVDDFINDSLKIREKYPDCYTWNCSQLGFSNYDLLMTMIPYDARFADEEGNYIVDKDPGVRKGLEQLKKIYDSGIVYWCTDLSPDYEEAVAKGRLVGDMLAMWLKAYIPGYAPDQTGLWSACLWPEEIRKGSDAGSTCYGIPVFSRYPEQAMELLEYMRLNKETSLQIFADYARNPITISAYEDPITNQPNPYFADNYSSWERLAANDENFAVFPYTPKATLEYTIMNEYASKYFTGAMSLDEALAGANADMINQIGNPYN